jgi:hypothetical protein
LSAIKEADKKQELLSGIGSIEEARRVFADWIRSGNGPKVDLEAAEEVKYLGLVANYHEYLLLDHSAWSGLLADRVPEDREETVLDWIDEGKLATCLPFLLETGFST